MKNLWKILFTAALCLLVLGGISALGFALRSVFPFLPSAVIVADGGIIFGGYKLILDTIRAANELEQVGLENYKLRLEIAEKESDKQRDSARIVVPTSDEIAKYSPKPSSSPRSRRSWAVGGGFAVLCLSIFAWNLIVYKNHQSMTARTDPPPNSDVQSPEAKSMTEAERQRYRDQMEDLEAAKPAFTPVCSSGRLTLTPEGDILFMGRTASQTTLRFVYSNYDATLTLPLRLRSEHFPNGEHLFHGESLRITIPASGTIRIETARGSLVTTCSFVASR